MIVTGIICEYNPLHNGHKKQIDFLHSRGHAVVCLMSGNFVQRGHPAIFDKMTRAKAALACGADLVIELPVHYALSSAEGFAAGGVEILSKLCSHLCFGAETADSGLLMDTANALLSPAFSEKLRLQLDKGLSFPSARAAALEDMGFAAQVLSTPNNILAVEYCKAILSQHSPLSPLVIHREGSYHDTIPNADNPSATALRRCLEQGEPWDAYVPGEVSEILSSAAIHTLQQGESAILYRLRTMTDDEFEALPYGSEGLWRKLMHASRSCNDLESIITYTKSKRYTRTRIDRMILCALLQLTEEQRTQKAPYARVLGFNDRGRSLLNSVKEEGFFLNIGQKSKASYEELEQRCGRIYGLFAQKPEKADQESELRVIYHKTER